MAGAFKQWSIKIKSDLRALLLAGEVPGLAQPLALASLEPGSLAWLDAWSPLHTPGPWSERALIQPWARVKHDFLRDGGRGWGATWDGVRPSGRRLWQAPQRFLCTESSRARFPALLARGSDLYLPSPAPSSRSQRVWREPGQRLRENEDISQMACPRGRVLAGRAWGRVGPDPCLSPKYPKYAPSLAAKPQQCLPSSPPPSDPGSARRPACRKGPEAPPLPGRSLGRLGARSAGPGLARTIRGESCPGSGPRRPILAIVPRAACHGACVRWVEMASWPLSLVPGSGAASLHCCVVGMRALLVMEPILTLTLCGTSGKVPSCSRPQSYHENSGGEERFGNFLLEFGGGSSDEREMAHQAPDFQSSPVFACSVHSINHCSFYTPSCAGRDRH